jgi:uncharacterized phiE125 gp8 family phage protein
MLIQTSAPKVEPVSLAEVRTFARAFADLDGAEDGMLSMMITAARQEAEAITQRSLITQSWRLVLDAFPGPSLMGVPYGVPYSIPAHAITLERGTVQTVASITYLQAGVWTTMDAANYVAELSGCPARITPVFGQIWPVIGTPQIGNVKVDYTAGYGDTAASVPAGIKQWICVRVATLYNNREEVAILQKGKMEVLPYIDGLLTPYTVVRY